MPLDITDSDVYAALKSFLALAVPAGTQILQGQQNEIPMPSTDFVLMTTIGAPKRIGTNVDSTEAVIDTQGNYLGFTAAVTADYEYRVQADFYGASAESWAMAAELLWRDGIAFDSMPANIKPLYTEDMRQAPIVAAENQWIQRWTMTLVLDYRPTWTQPTQAATSIVVVPEPIDVYLPPDWTADSQQVNTDSDRTM